MDGLCALLKLGPVYEPAFRVGIARAWIDTRAAIDPRLTLVANRAYSRGEYLALISAIEAARPDLSIILTFADGAMFMNARGVRMGPARAAELGVSDG